MENVGTTDIVNTEILDDIDILSFQNVLEQELAYNKEDENLLNEINILQQKVMGFKHKKETAENIAKKAVEQVCHLKSRCQSYEQQFKKQEEYCKEIESELKDTENEYNVLHLKYKNLCISNKELEATNKKNKENLFLFACEKDELKQKNKTLENELDKAKSDVETYRENKKCLEQNLSDAKNLLEKEIDQFVTFKRENTVNKRKLDRYEVIISEKKNQEKELNAGIKRLKAKSITDSILISSLLEKIEKLKKDRTAYLVLKNKYQILDSEYKKSLDLIDGYEKEIQRISNIAFYNKKLGVYKRDLYDIEKRNGEPLCLIDICSLKEDDNELNFHIQKKVINFLHMKSFILKIYHFSPNRFGFYVSEEYYDCLVDYLREMKLRLSREAIDIIWCIDTDEKLLGDNLNKQYLKYIESTNWRR